MRIRNQIRSKKTGFFSSVLSILKRNRLGELLVTSGYLSPHELRIMLRQQRQTGVQLGTVVVDNEIMSRAQLNRLLIKQSVLRGLATMLLFFAALGFGSQKARADLPDVPGKIAISASDHFSKVTSYPELFGADEERSHNLKPFTKWTGMFERFESELTQAGNRRAVEKWITKLERYADFPLKEMAEAVNDYVNESPYILDNKLWGKSDYWSTPIEFLRRGGDCEDFAIAKYTALRILGVPEERLRVAIVQDKVKNIPHAVLVVYTDGGPVVLDNQIKTLVDGSYQDRYRPIFSINRQAWWLHTAPGSTVVASAAGQ